MSGGKPWNILLINIHELIKIDRLLTIMPLWKDMKHGRLLV